jgi:AICAR transformylase/IMP cyclohydrolase PurH
MKHGLEFMCGRQIKMAKRFIKFVVNIKDAEIKNKLYMETDMNDRELNETLSEMAYENAADYDYMVSGYWEEISETEYIQVMEGR